MKHNPKIELLLTAGEPADDIVELNDFIREQNFKGIMTKVAEREPQPGEMSVADYMQIIELALASPVVAAGIKGLFNVLKNYFELKKEKIRSAAEVHRAESEQQKIVFNAKTSEGEKVTFKFSSFNESEREQFFNFVDKVFNK